MDANPSHFNKLSEGMAASVASLAAFEIQYALIGGLATSLRSQPRFTKAVDFLLKIPSLVLPGLLEDLLSRGFTFDRMTVVREWNQRQMVVMSYQGVRVDWLKPILPTYQHILDRATEEISDAGPIQVATIEGLILLKLIAFRPQDLLDIDNLLAACEKSLDLPWIQSEWRSITSIDDPRMRWFETKLATDVT